MIIRQFPHQNAVEVESHPPAPHARMIGKFGRTKSLSYLRLYGCWAANSCFAAKYKNKRRKIYLSCVIIFTRFHSVAVWEFQKKCPCICLPHIGRPGASKEWHEILTKRSLFISVERKISWWTAACKPSSNCMLSEDQVTLRCCPWFLWTGLHKYENDASWTVLDRHVA